MRIIISSLVIVFSLHSCKEIPITPLNITKSLTLIGEKQVTNNSFGYSITKDSLLIMITYGDADEKFIHVYDTAFNFKFSVGDKGKLFQNSICPNFSILTLSTATIPLFTYLTLIYFKKNIST